MIPQPNFIACSVCFLGQTDPSVYWGLKMGVLTLLSVIGFILILITKFFINVSKRSKIFADQI